MGCGGTLHEVLREKRVRCSFPARSSDPKPKFRSGDLELSDGKLTFTFKNYANRLAKHVIVLAPGFVVETPKSKSKYNYDDINALRIKNGRPQLARNAAPGVNRTESGKRRKLLTS